MRESSMDDLHLWQAIYDLYELLADEINAEDAYQRFFESHPVVFRVLGFDAHASYEKSSQNRLPYDSDRDFSPEPDFLASESRTCTLTVFELKTPFVPRLVVKRSDGQRRKLNATAESYVAQATEYADTIRENVEARRIVLRDLSLPRIAAYRVLLVYGLEKENDLQQVAQILENRRLTTQILCFDSMLQKLIASYDQSRRHTAGRVGGAAVYHIEISSTQRHSRAFIADHGDIDRNRISVYLERQQLCVHCVDSTGESHILRSSVRLDAPEHVRFEWSTDELGIYLSLNVGNVEKDCRIGSARLDVSFTLEGATIGTDLSHRYYAAFAMREMYYCSTTMTTEQKLGTYHYFKRKVADNSSAVVFDGIRQFMTVNKGPESNSPL